MTLTFNLSWVNSPLLAAKNLKLQWKPSVCEQNIFHTPSACSGVVHFLARRNFNTSLRYSNLVPHEFVATRE
jgi:hypothetical protein